LPLSHQGARTGEAIARADGAGERCWTASGGEWRAEPEFTAALTHFRCCTHEPNGRTPEAGAVPAGRVIMSTAVSNKGRKTPVAPVAIVNAAMRLRRFLLRAADRVVPPHLAVYDRFMGAAQTMLIHSAARYRIADILAEGGPLGAAEIA